MVYKYKSLKGLISKTQQFSLSNYISLRIYHKNKGHIDFKMTEELEKEIKKIKNIGNSKKLESQIGEPEPEIIEEVEIRKIKKPKKRIIRKIIKQQYDSDSTEEEYEEVVYEAPKVPKNSKRNNLNKESIKKEVAGAAGAAPKEEVKKSVFNLFSY